MVFVILNLFSPAFGADNALELRRNVALEFEAVENAVGYEVEVTKVLGESQKKSPIYFKVKEPKWQAKIRPGRYFMRLRSFDDRSVAGDWSEPSEFWVRVPAPKPLEPTQNATLQAKSNTEELVEFKWQAVPGVTSYRLEVHSDEVGFTQTHEVKDTQTSLQLPVASDYKWKVTSLTDEPNLSQVPPEPLGFTLMGSALEKPQINVPPSKFVAQLGWKRVEYAEHYSYVLQRKVASGWKIMKKGNHSRETEFFFDVAFPSGLYRLKVQAFADKRVKSDLSDEEFEVKAGFRDPAAVEEAILRDSIQKPTHWYAIASYFVTAIQYQGKIPQLGSKISDNPIGGTGRLGLGYQWLENPWGVFGVLDMSGFTIKEKTYTFASSEVHITYRKIINGFNDLKLSAGVFYKELPELIGANQTYTDTNMIESIGPHAGFTYWRPFNPRFGVQLNARGYYSLNGESEQGLAIEPTLSYQVGALGSLRLGEKWMGMAGYSFRRDNAKYKVGSNLQEVSIQGHYLNLILEYSF